MTEMTTRNNEIANRLSLEMFALSASRNLDELRQRYEQRTRWFDVGLTDKHRAGIEAVQAIAFVMAQHHVLTTMMRDGLGEVLRDADFSKVRLESAE